LAWFDKYTTSSHPYYSSLHTFWNFGEGTGDQTADITGHGHTGVITYTTSPTWVAGWAPAGVTVSAGTDENLYFGYAPEQCKTKTAIVAGGTAPFTYNWNLDRPLFPGESITGNTTASVSVYLMDTAQLCVTVTDACGFTVTDCAMLFAEDVRCNAGNSQSQKVMVCHNGNTICVDASAVTSHVIHGDEIGPCGSFTLPDIITESLKPGFTIYPNPGNGNINIIVNFADDNSDKTIRVLNMSGQIVREINMKQQIRTNITVHEAGVYLVQMISNKQVITKKLVVVH